MTRHLLELLASETHRLRDAGMFKREVIFSRGGGMVAGGMVDGTRGEPVVNFTTHDYLGLSRDTEVEAAATRAMDRHGMGLASQRVICGTLNIHKQVEERVAKFLRVPDALVYGSCYAANVGLFAPMFGRQDCILCDEAVHPSLAEGARLAGSRLMTYRNNDPEDLEVQLRRSRGARFRAVVTNGVFSLDGRVAKLADLCALAEAHDALVVVDDCLGVGVLGKHGRGTAELAGVIDKVDVVTGTFGKALGGASGGFAAGRAEIIDWLRQKSTPYLFSAALPPPMAGAALYALELLESGKAPLAGLRERTQTLRTALRDAGFRVLGDEHPLLAVEVGPFVKLQQMVNTLYDNGIYVHGLCHPLVPEGASRIRMLVSALHSQAHLDKAIAEFTTAGRAAGVI